MGGKEERGRKGGKEKQREIGKEKGRGREREEEREGEREMYERCSAMTISRNGGKETYQEHKVNHMSGQFVVDYPQNQ